jgi:hypothetical protein
VPVEKTPGSSGSAARAEDITPRDVALKPADSADLSDPAAGSPIRIDERQADSATHPAGTDSEELPLSGQKTGKVPWRARPAAAGMAGRWAPFVLLPVAITLWASALPTINLSRMNDYGLVSVVPVRTWLGFGALIVSFAMCWWRAERTTLLLTVHIFALIVMFYGIPAIIASAPRGPIVYRHAGVTDYLTRVGVVDARQDAYFGWPAFFMFLGSMVKFAGLPGALALAKWATVAVELLYLPPLLMTLRALTRDARVVWGAVLLFYATNWVNQDYLAPQSFAYLLYLTIIALVLGYLRPRTVADMGSLRVATWLRRHRLTRGIRWLFPVQPGPAPAGVPVAPAVGRSGAVVTLVIMILFAACVASHQLTPYAVFAAVTLLVITGHCRVRGLPVLMGVMLLAWTIFVAHGYIDGHLKTIADSSGDVSRATSANFTERLAGSGQHLLVVRERAMLSAAVWLLAALGALHRFRTRHADHAAVLLMLAPIPLFLLAYGGEVLLRIYFLSLPFAAFFAAALLVGPRAERAAAVVGRHRRIRTAVLDVTTFCVVGSVLLAGSFVARYGNEPMDTYSPGETAAVRELYRIAPLGSYLLAETNYLPWRYQDYEWNKVDPARQRHKYLSLSQQWKLEPDKSTGDMARWTAQVLRASADPKRPSGFVIVTRSQRAHEEILGGLAPSTLDEFERLLMQSGKFQLVYANPDATIYARKPGG